MRLKTSELNDHLREFDIFIERHILYTVGHKAEYYQSPYLFAIYIDSVVKKVIDSKIGCYVKMMCISILLMLMSMHCYLHHTALQQLLLL